MHDFNFWMLVVVVALAIGFDFINGFHDTANAIATSVATRVLPIKWAIFMAAGLNFFGALMSEKVAKTISKGIVNDVKLSLAVVAAALLAAIIWNLITWYFGIPSSSSHALIGGLIGASVVHAFSLDVVSWNTVLMKVILPLLASPLVGYFAGLLVMTLLYKLLRKATNSGVNRVFSKLQIVSAAFMAYSHGNNDAQKSMGIIALALLISGQMGPNDSIPIWVKLSCALAMALGTSIGGWKIIKTMGVNMMKLEPIGGFAAETSAALVIETATALGMPVSTTHVISTSIMGVGSSKRLSAVRWSLARNIVWAWVLTIPLTMLLGGFITSIFAFFKLT
jgi:PiT family inorganic phosphate transporter